jgi:hypothetical protein
MGVTILNTGADGSRILRKLIVPAISCLVLAVGLASAGLAAGSLAEKLPMDVIYKADAPIVMPVGKELGHAAVDLPTAPKKPGQVLCIRFKALYKLDDDAKPIVQLANYYLGMEVNGKVLESSTPDETDRLLNRGKVAQNIDGNFPWWDRNKLCIYLGHETGEMDDRVLGGRQEEYWYVVNISDDAEYVWKGVDEMTLGGKPNKIVFTGYRTDASNKPMPGELRIENLEMGYLPKETVDKLAPISSAMSVPKLTGPTIKAGGYALTVAPSGAMSIQLGKETYAFRSFYSYPSDPDMQFHQFTWETAKDTDWKKSSSEGKDGSFTIKGESAAYSVTRKVTAKDGKFYVSDTIKNKTGDPLGMAVRYEVASPNKIMPNDCYLSGVAGIKDNTWCGQNPTIFLKNPGGSLGVVAEDDLFEFQLNMIKKKNSVQFGTEHFGLEPKKSYTIAWSIYPSRATDYFDFINRIRREWKLNFTIPGMMACSPKNMEAFNYKYHGLPPWFDCYEGVGLTTDEYVQKIKAEVKALKAQDPDAVCMPELETPAFGLIRSRIEGGDKIPGKPKVDTLTLVLNKEQSAIVKKAAGPLWDSVMKNKDGNAVIDTHYTEPAKDDFNLNVHPEIGNSWFKHMLGQVDIAMDKCGCEGVYMDSFEFAYSLSDGGYRADYSSWDGHSVNLDRSGRISDKLRDLDYVSTTAKVAIIDYVRKKGGWCATNGHPVARVLRQTKYMNFTETDWEEVPDYDGLLKLLSPNEPDAGVRMASGHLGAPIAEGIAMWRSDLFGPPCPKDFRENNSAEIQQKYVIACLRNGQLYYPYAEVPLHGPGAGDYGILREMFPFTPVELHEGYLIGKEKILTAVSGTFYWDIKDHPQKPSVCKAFDKKGYQISPKSFTVTKVGNQWKIKLALQQDWMGTAAVY